jgi:hypothetical protein
MAAKKKKRPYYGRNIDPDKDYKGNRIAGFQDLMHSFSIDKEKDAAKKAAGYGKKGASLSKIERERLKNETWPARQEEPKKKKPKKMRSKYEVKPKAKPPKKKKPTKKRAAPKRKPAKKRKR